MQCRGSALEDARIAFRRGDQHVHAALQTVETELVDAMGVLDLVVFESAIACKALRGVTGSVRHYCWRYSVRYCCGKGRLLVGSWMVVAIEVFDSHAAD
jgi:hypothetical protein